MSMSVEVAESVLRHECQTKEYHHDIRADSVLREIVAPTQISHNDEDYTERHDLTNFHAHVERQKVGQ